jgi:hypothetical protein
VTDGDAPRPAPQYGEYATPEQQRELIRRSGGTPPEADGAPGAAPPPAPVAPAPVPPALAARSAGDSADGAPTRRGDRFVTIALLAYGLFTVVTTVPQLVRYSSFAQSWLEMAGIQAEFTAVESGRLWGGIAAAVFAIGWIATTLISWWMLTRGRISWWIPIVGAVVTFVVVSIGVSVPLMSDPAIVEQILRSA